MGHLFSCCIRKGRQDSGASAVEDAHQVKSSPRTKQRPDGLASAQQVSNAVKAAIDSAEKLHTQDAGPSSKFAPEDVDELLSVPGAKATENAGVSRPSPEATRAAAEALKGALKVAEKALSSLSLPIVKGSIGFLLSVAGEVEKARASLETLEQLTEYITSISEVVLNPLRTLSEEDIPEGMRLSLEKLVRVRDKWEPRLAAGRGILRRAMEATADEAELKKFVNDVKSVVEQFQLAMSIHGHVAYHRQEKQLEAALSQQKVMFEDAVFRDRARLVDGLPRATSAQYNSGREAYSSCFEGTRVQVIEKIMSWIHVEDGSPNCGMFWLNGVAGIGKSTIAKTVAAKLDRKRLLGGSFFFSRNVDELTNPALLFPTLAFQLAQVDKSFKSSIGKVLEINANSGYATQRRILVFVIDALDECRDDVRASDLVQLLLSHLGNIPFTVRVLLTSRPEPHIKRIFEGRTIKRLVLHCDIEKQIVQDDIHLYLQENLKAIPSKLGVSIEAGWPRETHLETLVERSGTLFIYAATAVRFIGNNYVRQPMRQLEILLGVQEAQGTQPYSELDVLYLEILNHAFPIKHVGKQLLDTIRWLLGALVLLRNPLPLAALAAFTEVKLDVIRDFALYRLQSVIITPESDDDAPQIYHPSFPDFLTNPTRCSNPDYLVQISDTERRLAIRCLKLCKRSLRRNILNVGEDNLLNEDIPQLEDLVKSVLPPAVQYACLYWSSHLRGVADDDDAMVRDLLDFASHYLLFWFEAMSLLKQIGRAITAMLDAHSWADRTSNEELKTLMYDGYRFIISHQAAIDSGALQVYYSALPFTPQETELYKKYKSAEKGSRALRVLHGVPKKWTPCLSSLSGEHGSIVSVAYSHDGKLFALGFEAPWITIREASSGASLSAFELPTPQEVLSLAFLPDNEHVVAGTTSGCVWQWSVVTSTQVRCYSGHSSTVTCVAVCVKAPDCFASTSNDATIRLWSILTGECLYTLSCDGSLVHTASFTPDGARLLSGSEDGIVRIWDVLSPWASSLVSTISAHEASILTLAISPDGESYCTGATEKQVKVFPIRRNMPTFTLIGHSSEIVWVLYSPDGTTLLSVGREERYIRLWNTSNGTLKGLSRGGVSQIAYSPNGGQLVTSSSDGVCRLWIGANLSVPIDPDDHGDWVVSVTFSRDGKLLASGSRDKTVRIWDVIKGTRKHTLVGHRGAVRSLAFSDDTCLLASGSALEDGTVRVWEVTSGQLLFTLSGHDKIIWAVKFSPDSLCLISKTLETTYTWSISTGPASGAVLIAKEFEDNKDIAPKNTMYSDSQGYFFGMKEEHRLHMEKDTWASPRRGESRVVSAVQEDYIITGYALHADRAVFGCTDGSLLILDISPLKAWFD